MTGPTPSTMKWAARAMALAAFGLWTIDMRASSGNSCEFTCQCGGGDTPACVGGECEPCSEDPGQCEEYEIPGCGNLSEAFCDGAEGACWECTDCVYAMGGLGCDEGGMQCAPCTGSGRCPMDHFCNTQDAMCQPIPEAEECSLTAF
jgi:hypothetical protein